MASTIAAFSLLPEMATALADTGADAQLLALFREWQQLGQKVPSGFEGLAEYDGKPDEDYRQEKQRVSNRHMKPWNVMAEIGKLPAKTPAGLLAKIDVLSADEYEIMDDCMRSEGLQGLFAGFVEDVRKLANASA
jgi:hypothetical protein